MRKMFGHYKRRRERREEDGRVEGNPPGYEGKEHVKYRDPGHSPHHIKYPEDEPHMKSYIDREETHEMEDNFHMGVPDQTERELPAKIKRARMKMDMPNYNDPKPIPGNPVHNVNRGEIYDDGIEEMGPNYEQEPMSKEHRKKMVIAVARRRMNRHRR